MGAGVQFLLVHPLDLVQTRMAVDVGPANDREFMGSWNCLQRLLLIGGVKDLYCGKHCIYCIACE